MADGTDWWKLWKSIRSGDGISPGDLEVAGWEERTVAESYTTGGFDSVTVEADFQWRQRKPKK